jgi:hypothetical protein
MRLERDGAVTARLESSLCERSMAQNLPYRPRVFVCEITGNAVFCGLV